MAAATGGMLEYVISPTGRPWLDELAASTGRFRDVLAAAEEDDGALDSPVAACPEWDLRALGVHLGQTHLWAAGIVQGADPRQRPRDEPAGQSLSRWYASAAEALRKALAEAGPEAPCWTLVRHQGTALFWQRRQVHETMVHLWDAHHAVGQTAALDPALAFDGVAEVAEVMYPRMLRAKRVEPLPKRLVLTATDVDADPVTIGEAEQAVAVTAPAEQLLLVVWQRIPWRQQMGPAEAESLLSRALVP